MRALYVWDPETREMVEVRNDWKPSHTSDVKNSFTSDEMEPTQSMVTKRWHTSRSKLRQEYRSHGREEIGNEKFPESKPKERPSAEHHIREAVRQLKWGEAKLSEYDRHRCQIINHNLKHYNYDRRR